MGSSGLTKMRGIPGDRHDKRNHIFLLVVLFASVGQREASVAIQFRLFHRQLKTPYVGLSFI